MSYNQMMKCKKKYTSSSGLASPRKTTDYSVKFFGIHFAICWHPIVKHIKQNKSNNMTNIKKWQIIRYTS